MVQKRIWLVFMLVRKTQPQFSIDFTYMWFSYDILDLYSARITVLRVVLGCTSISMSRDTSAAISVDVIFGLILTFLTIIAETLAVNLQERPLLSLISNIVLLLNRVRTL